HNELKWRVVHRKKSARATELPPAGPVSGAAPSLLGDAERNECQLNLARFDQPEVFDRAFGFSRGHEQAELASQEPRKTLTIKMVCAAGRSCPDGECIRPIRLRGSADVRISKDRDDDRGDPQQCAPH